MELFYKSLKVFSKKNLIIDVSLGSKYVFDTLVNFIVIYGLLHITLDFYMAPRSISYLSNVLIRCNYELFVIL